MLLIIVSNIKESLRGKLSLWLIELKPGVFLGNPSSRVRENLWRILTDNIGKGSALLIWSDSTCEQGYRWRSEGKNTRQMIDMDGVSLMQKKIE